MSPSARVVSALLLASALCSPFAVHAQVLHADGYEQCQPQWPMGSTSEWNSALMPWPAYGQSARLSIPFNGYVALRFTTPSSPGQFGTFTLVDYPSSGGGSGLISISRSPGCFDPAFVPPNCLSQVSGEPGISWIIAASELRCTLEPGVSYYLNMTLGTSGGSGRDLSSTVQ